MREQKVSNTGITAKFISNIEESVIMSMRNMNNAENAC